MRASRVWVGLLSALALGTFASTSGPAKAATVATLTNCGFVTGGCGSATAPYGQVDLTGTTLTITLFDGFQFFGSGNAPQAVVAFNTTGATSVSGLPSGFTWVAGSTPSGNPPGGIGTMNNYITTDTTNIGLGSTLAYTFTGTFSPDSKGFFFAVDVCTGLNSDNHCTGNTGWLTTGLVATPLPPAALLFGTALAGLGVLGRRRKQKIA